MKKKDEYRIVYENGYFLRKKDRWNGYSFSRCKTKR